MCVTLPFKGCLTLLLPLKGEKPSPTPNVAQLGSEDIPLQCLCTQPGHSIHPELLCLYLK